MALLRSTAPVRPGRLAALAAAVVLGAAVLAGCSGDGTDVSCSLDSCNVTFDRGVEAKASILGVDVELVGVQSDTVSLKVGDNQLDVPVGDGQGQAEAGGLLFEVTEVTDNTVVMKVSKA